MDARNSFVIAHLHKFNVCGDGRNWLEISSLRCEREGESVGVLIHIPSVLPLISRLTAPNASPKLISVWRECAD
jgi:hypothetical protein